jgi:hypothetical protein
MEENKQLTLSWKMKLGIFLGTLLMGLLFVSSGRFELARPALFSIVVIGFAIAMKWELKGRAWFWATMLLITALHVALILCVPWTTQWIPALVITPVAVVDITGILGIIKLLEKKFES